MSAISQTPQALDVLTCPLSGVNLIEASAGTGKTWTICGLYLRLLLERGFSVEEILVVTFTNAATAELRERIRARIYDLLEHLRGSPWKQADPFICRLSADLTGRLQLEPRQIMVRLELALHSFDEAAILTIHGFCQRALADNPFAAGLPMHTELLESDRSLVMETVYDFWRRHAAGESTPELARFIVAEGDSPEKYARLLERHLAKPLARHIWPSDVLEPPQAASLLHDAYAAVRAHWLIHKEHISTLMHAALSQLHGQVYKAASIVEAAAHWDLLCRDAEPLAQVGKKAHLFRDSVLREKTKKNCQTPTHAFFRHAEDYLSARDRLEHSLMLARCRLLQRLFAQGALHLQALKRSHQVVAFNDMLANLHERLHHPNYPWLAASIRARFPAALIDEFQDTDPLQLGVFKKIYSSSGAVVFLVGDPKQAIYSFRHADLHSYVRATHWADRHWSLTSNQRSSATLLAALNRLFSNNGAAFVLPEIRYRKVEYGDKPRSSFVDASEQRAPFQVWRLPDHGGALPKLRARRAAVDATAAEIARLLQAGQDDRISLDGRALLPGDIAVLVRTRSLGGEIKRALAALRVGSVELSRDGIFSSPDARDWEIVLTAIAAPSRETFLRAALASMLFGKNALQIEAITADTTQISRWILQFMEYRDLWVNRGFGVMYRQLLADQGVARRLLSRSDGERRLTNCMHVGEELQKAAESHRSPEALLRYFKSAQEDENPLDAAQLRLESDLNLVQIVTIHACKGLEYPIVFCPFLCDGSSRSGGSSLEGYEYHDATLQPVIDFNRYTDAKDPELLAIKAQIKAEQSAETVRLIYVALTRAVHRCYLVMGPYETPRSKHESARSMLNWLVAGSFSSPDDWFGGNLATAQLDSAWTALAATSEGAVAIAPLPTTRGIPVSLAFDRVAALRTQAPPGRIDPTWRISSYSGLCYGARNESPGSDHDDRTVVTADSGKPVVDTPLYDILNFPRGASAGDCIHAVFENIDFTNRAGWEEAIADALASHPQPRVGDPVPESATTLNRMLLRLVEDVTATNLQPGLQLSSVAPDRRLTELEFNLPVPRLTADALNTFLKTTGYDVPPLTFGVLEGYLNGFIDLVFEHRGKYFILDWKSNHLGNSPAAYASRPIERAMADHGYHLQYLLYSVALHRYLQMRVPHYRYETHFGGVFYLFVRGVRPQWSESAAAVPGVFFRRPDPDTIRTLGQLFHSSSNAALNPC